MFQTFRKVIDNCFRLEDRNIRNDICILINYVVSSPESHSHFIFADEMTKSTKNSFFEVLLSYATLDETSNIKYEIESKNEANENNKSPNEGGNFFFTTSPDDVEFKKIIWTCILYVIKDNYNREEVTKIIKEYTFISCLLLYLDPDAMKFSCISRWQQPQLKDIQVLCLSILLNIIPLYQK